MPALLTVDFMRYFLHGLFLLAGCFSLLCAPMNWDWFFQSPNTRLIVRNIGRTYARIFYAVVGLALLVFGIIGLLS